MIKKMYYNLLLLCTIIGTIIRTESDTTKTSRQLCLSLQKTICYPCTKSKNDYGICTEIRDEMNTIIFNDIGSKTKIDYDSYVNSNIKIIHEHLTTTMYSCDVNDKYIHVNKSNFYPIDRSLRFPKYPTPTRKSNIKTPFEHCLATYCLTNNNYFTCKIHLVDNFDFEFNVYVTMKCVQNITKAHISSSSLTHLYLNQFFKHAYNLIYLTLSVHNLKYFTCSVFEDLLNLRLLDFSYFNLPMDRYRCIFQHNNKLIRVRVANVYIWSYCDNVSTTTSTVSTTVTDTKKNDIDTITELLAILTDNDIDNYVIDKPQIRDRTAYYLLLLLLVVALLLLLSFYCYKKEWIASGYRDDRRRRRCEHIRRTIQFEENHI